VPAYRTAFRHIPQIITAADVRNSDVAEVWCLRFADVIAVITGPMCLSYTEVSSATSKNDNFPDQI